MDLAELLFEGGSLKDGGGLESILVTGKQDQQLPAVEGAAQIPAKLLAQIQQTLHKQGVHQHPAIDLIVGKDIELFFEHRIFQLHLLQPRIAGGEFPQQAAVADQYRMAAEVLWHGKGHGQSLEYLAGTLLILAIPIF